MTLPNWLPDMGQKRHFQPRGLALESYRNYIRIERLLEIVGITEIVGIVEIVRIIEIRGMTEIIFLYGSSKVKHIHSYRKRADSFCESDHGLL